ncbi:MAG: PaaI family thioesterase [Aureispira sp.]|nr:PaaI family thioesterase [Aureispira sp.]
MLDPQIKERVQLGFEKQAFMAFIGAELTKLEEGVCEIQLPFKMDLTQQNGFFHGGIVGTLADNAAGFAACSQMTLKQAPLTVEYKLNLMNKADGDRLVARGKVLKNGRTLKVCESKIYIVQKNGEEKLCAAALATIMTVSLINPTTKKNSS